MQLKEAKGYVTQKTTKALDYVRDELIPTAIDRGIEIAAKSKSIKFAIGVGIGVYLAFKRIPGYQKEVANVPLIVHGAEHIVEANRLGHGSFLTYGNHIVPDEEHKKKHQPIDLPLIRRVIGNVIGERPVMVSRYQSMFKPEELQAKLESGEISEREFRRKMQWKENIEPDVKRIAFAIAPQTIPLEPKTLPNWVNRIFSRRGKVICAMETWHHEENSFSKGTLEGLISIAISKRNYAVLLPYYVAKGGGDLSQAEVFFFPPVILEDVRGRAAKEIIKSSALAGQAEARASIANRERQLVATTQPTKVPVAVGAK